MDNAVYTSNIICSDDAFLTRAVARGIFGRYQQVGNSLERRTENVTVNGAVMHTDEDVRSHFRQQRPRKPTPPANPQTIRELVRADAAHEEAA